MNFNEQNHPFDTATQLTKGSGIYYGHTSERYANMVGPFGGVVAATLLRAVMEHPERKGEPVALTINYAAPVSDGDFNIKAKPVRTNRSTQHWYIELCQEKDIIITGTAVLASRRDTWSATEMKFPDVPTANEVKNFPLEGMPSWVHNYDMKIVQGSPFSFSQPNTKDTSDSVTLQWIQDKPRRTIDFLSLAAMCDAFFPRIYVRRKQMVPIGTVSLTVYFHIDSETLAEHGNKELLDHARALQYRDGFFDQTAEMWSPEGKLLATTSQLVYYKE
ncbi:thioesterase family protein [Oceanobacillus sojae]|uniref:Acyl-CoA thioesterase n=1 Tax=Oceanobacillus sojae TaxID=582851 RepID=A0A511ZQE3_9BACI|nr:thioesterase family protein [Oceanobacillus sojae]GEN89673.1 acyl-CoA thioesterase [Oceanobacillus sojae]